jgi:hypothetical protein
MFVCPLIILHSKWQSFAPPGGRPWNNAYAAVILSNKHWNRESGMLLLFATRVRFGGVCIRQRYEFYRRTKMHHRSVPFSKSNPRCHAFEVAQIFDRGVLYSLSSVTS